VLGFIVIPQLKRHYNLLLKWPEQEERVPKKQRKLPRRDLGPGPPRRGRSALRSAPRSVPSPRDAQRSVQRNVQRSAQRNAQRSVPRRGERARERPERERRSDPTFDLHSRVSFILLRLFIKAD